MVTVEAVLSDLSLPTSYKDQVLHQSIFAKGVEDCFHWTNRHGNANLDLYAGRGDSDGDISNFTRIPPFYAKIEAGVLLVFRRCDVRTLDVHGHEQGPFDVRETARQSKHTQQRRRTVSRKRVITDNHIQWAMKRLKSGCTEAIEAIGDGWFL